ncbi:unnamed protein product [Protopolystoma xenopodis]|uniref:Uncharacterized protein n=1 Tax=Protopolystoma xenopodis TaxID=117903 RepID=A0A448XND0_9PLAT|nr:unnamed protein product [Protopolystoma xenopodis]
MGFTVGCVWGIEACGRGGKATGAEAMLPQTGDEAVLMLSRWERTILARRMIRTSCRTVSRSAQEMSGVR